MEYQKVKLFGDRISRGTFYDFFDGQRYSSLNEAYLANDYVECNFVRDEDKILYIEAVNMSEPDIKKYHKLHHQEVTKYLDLLDEMDAIFLAQTLFSKSDSNSFETVTEKISLTIN